MCDSDSIFIEHLFTPVPPGTTNLQQAYDASLAGDKSIVLTGLAADGVSISNPAGNGTTNLFSVANDTTRTDLLFVNNDGSTVIGGNVNGSVDSSTLATVPNDTLVVNKTNGLMLVNLVPGANTNANLPFGTNATTAPNYLIVPYPALINTPPAGSFTGSLNLPSLAAPTNTVYGLTLRLLGVATTAIPKDVFNQTVQTVLYPNITGGLTSIPPVVTETSSLPGVVVSFNYAAPAYSFTITNGSAADINWRVVEEFITMNI